VADEHGTARQDARLDAMGEFARRMPDPDGPMFGRDVRWLITEYRALAAREQTLRQALENENRRANQLGAIVLACIEAGHVTKADAAALAADAPAPESGTRTVTYDAQTQCGGCRTLKAWTPTETVEGRSGFKCECCGWWTWLDAPAPKETP